MMDKEKSGLNQLKKDIQKWKDEGYEIDDIERLVNFASQHKRPTLKRRIIHITILSILLAIIFILVTLPYGFISGNQFAKTIGTSASFTVGFPFHWFSIVYMHPAVNIDEMMISSWSNLVFDFIIYIVAIFSIFYFSDLIFKKIKQRR